MSIYIALLRGINVGGHNKIKMAELKILLEEMGLHKVKTYIQSGNVLFESEDDALSLRKRLEEGIEERFRFKVPVVLRTSEEWENVIKDCPYAPEELREGESINVAFLGEEPSEEGLERLNSYQNEMDHFQIIGKNVYLFFRHSIRDSKLAANLPKLGVPATVRNWNTVLKLGELAQIKNAH
jgi:uncharacterized protein (DUF1697 family)